MSRYARECSPRAKSLGSGSGKTIAAEPLGRRGAKRRGSPLLAVELR